MSQEVATKQRGKIGGVFTAEIWRPTKNSRSGGINYELIDVLKSHNIITNEGLDAILDIMLHASTQITTWYCVMSETNTSPAAGMTYATPSFTETTAYDEANRPEYNEAAASSQSITNSANKAQFTMNATKTLYGAALVGGGTGASTKGDTAGGGTLLCYALFASSRGVVDDDVVNLTYTVSAADDGV